MKNAVLPVVALALMVLWLSASHGQTSAPQSEYVAARIQRTHFFTIWCFTKHHDCAACLVADVTSAELVRLHYDFAHISCDEDPELAAEFHIDSYPTFVALAHRREVGRIDGYVPTPKQVTDLFAPYRTESVVPKKRRNR